MTVYPAPVPLFSPFLKIRHLQTGNISSFYQKCAHQAAIAQGLVQQWTGGYPWFPLREGERPTV